MELSAEKTTIANLLSRYNAQFRIPVYQRPYAWEFEQIDDLWDDLISALGGRHFLGSIVVSDEEENLPNVIDGQQRLTTIAILLGLLRDELHALGSAKADLAQRLLTDDLADGDAKFRIQLGVANRRVFRDLVLRHPTDALRLDPASIALTREERLRNVRLLENRDRLRDRVRMFVSESTGAEREQRIERLLRTIVSGLEIVAIRVGQINDAFLLFETLNDRGLQLSAADLLKNHLLARVAKETGGEDEILRVAAEWDGMVDDLGSDVDVVRFFRHFLLVRRPDVSKERVYDRFKELAAESSPELTLSELRIAAKSYGEFESPSRVAVDEEEVRSVLRDLKTIRAVRCYVTLLPARRWLSSADFVRIARTAEVLTYRYSNIGGRDAKSLEGVYHRAARIIDESRGELLADALDILRAAVPSDEDFISDFMRQRMGVQYLLRYTLERIEASLSHSSEWMLKPGAKVHVEHIMPKVLSRPWREELGDQAETAVDHIEEWGNLTLLAARLNLSAGNDSFEMKKRHYQVSEVSLTLRLCESDHWDIAAIEARQLWLAKQATALWSVEVPSDGTSPEIDRPSLGLPSALNQQFVTLCIESSFQDLLEMRTRIQRYFAFVEIEAANTEDIDLHTAKRITEVLLRLVDDANNLDSSQRCLVRGAAEYFLLSDDAVGDMRSLAGFLDDAQVVDAVCVALGRPDLQLSQ